VLNHDGRCVGGNSTLLKDHVDSRVWVIIHRLRALIISTSVRIYICNTCCRRRVAPRWYEWSSTGLGVNIAWKKKSERGCGSPRGRNRAWEPTALRNDVARSLWLWIARPRLTKTRWDYYRNWRVNINCCQRPELTFRWVVVFAASHAARCR